MRVDRLTNYHHSTSPGKKQFTFHANTSSDYAALGKAFDVTIPTPPAQAEVNKLRADLDAIEAKYPEPDFYNLVATTPPEKWEKELDKMAHAEAVRGILHRGLQKLQPHLWAAEKDSKKGPENYDYIITHLPIDQVEQDFQDACRALGTAAFDLGEAIDKDPVALKTMREAGQKLTALGGLPRNPHDGSPNPRRVAISAEVDNLPRLTADQLREATAATPTYTEEEMALHTAAEDAIRLAREDHTTFLIHLAQGKWPNLHLNVARTHQQFVDRFTILADAGNIEVVRVTPGEARQRRRDARNNTKGTDQ